MVLSTQIFTLKRLPNQLWNRRGAELSHAIRGSISAQRKLAARNPHNTVPFYAHRKSSTPLRVELCVNKQLCFYQAESLRRSNPREQRANPMRASVPPASGTLWTPFVKIATCEIAPPFGQKPVKTISSVPFQPEILKI